MSHKGFAQDTPTAQRSFSFFFSVFSSTVPCCPLQEQDVDKHHLSVKYDDISSVVLNRRNVWFEHSQAIIQHAWLHGFCVRGILCSLCQLCFYQHKLQAKCSDPAQQQKYSITSESPTFKSSWSVSVLHNIASNELLCKKKNINQKNVAVFPIRMLLHFFDCCPYTLDSSQEKLSSPEKSTEQHTKSQFTSHTEGSTALVENCIRMLSRSLAVVYQDPLWDYININVIEHNIFTPLQC